MHKVLDSYWVEIDSGGWVWSALLQDSEGVMSVEVDSSVSAVIAGDELADFAAAISAWAKRVKVSELPPQIEGQTEIDQFIC